MKRNNGTNHRRVSGINGYVVISNCPRCGGALFWCEEEWMKRMNLSYCFHCGRIYTLKGKQYILWRIELKSSDEVENLRTN